MTASLLSPAQTAAIASLPLLSARVLGALLASLYAEPGYSDVDAKDIAKAIGEPVDRVKGALGSLVQKGLVDAIDMEANGKVLPLLYTDLHNDNDGEDGDARKAEAIVMVTNRIRVAELEATGVIPVSPEPQSGIDAATGTTKAERDVREAPRAEDMEALAMIAIFGRQSGLSWTRITAAMGEKVSFCHRLRPIMKTLAPGSVRPSYVRAS